MSGHYPHSPDDAVCAVCGLRLHWWYPGKYKHAASGTTGPSCGRPPMVTTRAKYDAALAALHSPAPTTETDPT